ncbi:MAG: hypothetical protein KatS3mg097_647 [Candidatus Parcubacteria bacterium]|nr:MAG: hypothetical protein KatS3mg097_647 [Candidatus Parcubacteria bacterium]
MFIQILNIFKRPVYLISWIFLTFIFVTFFIIVQIYFTPDYRANPELIFLVLKPKDYFLLTTFAFLIALNFVLSVYTFRLTNKIFDSSKSLIQNIPAVFSSLFTGIIATAFCTSCLVSVLSFLGTSTAFGLTLFSLKYKSWIILGNFIFLILLTFYNLKNISKIVNKNEKECNC